MFKRSYPVGRVYQTLTFPTGAGRPGRPRCWVTQRGRSVTRVAGLGRGAQLGRLRGGRLWGWIRSGW